MRSGSAPCAARAARASSRQASAAVASSPTISAAANGTSTACSRMTVWSGKPHAIGRQHPRIGVDENRLHPEFVGHQAGMLAAGAAKALQRKAGGVVPLLHRDLLDRIGHVADRDAQETLGDRACVAWLRRWRARSHRRARRISPATTAASSGWSAARAEDRRKMRRLNLADADIGVGHGERAAAAVAGGPRIGAGGVGADAEAGAVEMQDRAAARRHRVDRHHRRAHAHAGHLGFERPLEFAGVERHVGRGAAHVEADDPVEARRRQRSGPRRRCLRPGPKGSRPCPESPSRRRGRRSIA